MFIKKILTLFLIGIGTVSCTETTAVRLSWDTSANSNYHYTKEAFPTNMVVDIDAMLAKPELLEAKISELKSIVLVAKEFPIQLSMASGATGEIDILAKQVAVEYSAVAVDENEHRKRKLLQKMIGVVQLNTTINKFGINLNSYSKRAQHNLVTMLFRLPDHKVVIGESWQLPIVMSSLSNEFLADKTHRINKVWIKSITNKPGEGKIAEIVYLIQENVEGQWHQNITKKSRSFRVTANYFAVGEYNLNKHQWLRYVGRLDTSVGSLFRTINLMALLPSR